MVSCFDIETVYGIQYVLFHCIKLHFRLNLFSKNEMFCVVFWVGFWTLIHLHQLSGISYLNHKTTTVEKIILISDNPEIRHFTAGIRFSGCLTCPWLYQYSQQRYRDSKKIGVSTNFFLNCSYWTEYLPWTGTYPSLSMSIYLIFEACVIMLKHEIYLLLLAMLKIAISVSIKIAWDFRVIYYERRTAIEYKLRPIKTANKQLSSLNPTRSYTEINCV